MAEFLRPEAKAAIWRWREVMVALAILALGLWWGLTAFAVLQWLGWALTLIGVALAVAAVQRVRFRQGGGGIGVVQVDERRLAYFGPLTGGVIDLGDLVRVDLDPTANPAAHWILTARGETLAIPVNAEGADQLFDIFASLPGIRTEQMLAAMQGAPDKPVNIWARPAARLH